MVTQFSFDILDAVIRETTGRGLVPEQDTFGGTFVWMCKYAGANFYMEVHPADTLWLQDGI